MKAITLGLVILASCAEPIEEKPDAWYLDLPRTGVMATGNVTCAVDGFDRMVMTVVEPLDAPKISGDAGWHCVVLTEADEVLCTKIELGEGQDRASLNITATRIEYTYLFVRPELSGACSYRFGW